MFNNSVVRFAVTYILACSAIAALVAILIVIEDPLFFPDDGIRTIVTYVAGSYLLLLLCSFCYVHLHDMGHGRPRAIALSVTVFGILMLIAHMIL